MANQGFAFSKAREASVVIFYPRQWLDRDLGLLQYAVAPRLDLVRLLLPRADEPRNSDQTKPFLPWT